MDAPRQLYDLAGADPAFRFSPYCWRARFALAHKGLRFEAVPWRLHETDRLAFSGQAKVPVLVDGERTVSDSWSIAAYLEAQYPDAPSLFGAPEAVGATHVLNAWTDVVINPLISRLVALEIHDHLDPRDQAYFRRTREARFNTTLEAFVADRPAHLGRLRDALAPIRVALDSQSWLGGDEPRYADYVVAGSLQWARLSLPVALLADEDPLARWFAAVLALHGGPGRDATPAHPR